MRTAVALIAAGFWLLLAACSQKATTETSPLIDTRSELGLASSKIRYFTDVDSKEIVPVLGETGGPASGASNSGAAQGTAGETEVPFTIVDKGPVDLLPPEVRRPSIWVAFSQPVVSIAALGKSAASSPVMKIDPPIAGTFHWYGTRLLSFDAAADAIPQHLYHVRIDGSTTSVGGKPLVGDKDFSFHTEYLSLSGFFVGQGNEETSEVPLQDAKRITLNFNWSVNLDVIGRYLHLSAGGTDYPFTLSRPADRNRSKDELERMVQINVVRDMPENTRFTLTIGKGARSESDFLGTPNDITRELTTQKPFAYVRVSTDSYSFPGSTLANANPLFLVFNHPVDPKSLTGNLRTEPEMTIGAENVDVYGETVRINDLPVAPESSYVLIIGSGIRDIYGASLGAAKRISVKVPPAESYYYFPNTGTRMLESQFPAAIVYEFQNILSGIWRAGRIADPYASFNSASLTPFDFSRIPKNIRHLEKLDLRPWLNDDGKGYVGLSWNFAALDKKGDRPSWAQENLQVEVTDLGLTMRYGANRAVLLVSRLSTGDPVAGATVSLMRDHSVIVEGTTDKSGLAVINLKPGDYFRYFGDKADPWVDHIRVGVRSGTDSIEFAPNQSQDPYHFGVYNVSSPVEIDKPKTVTLLFTDRGIYRPGETVTFRGIDRTLLRGRYGLYVGPYHVELRDTTDDPKTIAELSGTTTESGGFYGSFKLPSDLDPGSYVISYTRTGTAEHDTESQDFSFDVADFRRLDYEVRVSAPQQYYVLGDTLGFQVHADYLSGGALSGAHFEYSWDKSPLSFSPPTGTWGDWSFGPAQSDQSYALTSQSGSLDGEGNGALIQKSTQEGVVGEPYLYTAEARVSDASNQEVAARDSAAVYPAEFMIGARLDRPRDTWSPFVAKGEEAKVAWSLVDPSGNLAAPPGGELGAALYRVTWKLAEQNGASGEVLTRYERIEELEADQRTPLTSPQGQVTVRPAKAGSYLLRLSAQDSRGRKALTDYQFYATGSDVIRWSSEENNDIGLVADKSVYRPGDTAKLLVQSPLPEGTYLVTVEREGILDQYLMSLKGSAQVIGIPIKAGYLPIVYVSVSSYSKRSGPPSDSYFKPDLGKPRSYFGIAALSIDTAEKQIDLSILPTRPTYRPGSEAEVTLTASYEGKPLEGAEITFLAVDRGVLDLIDYHVPNPLSFFYSQDQFPLGVFGADSRSLLMDPVTYTVKDLYGGAGGGGKAGEARRLNFEPTAVFKPFLTTDRDGKVVVRFTLPDNLTTYRLTAVAVDRDRFGFAEGSLVAQNPINVRAALPRAMRVRDTAFAGVIVTNLDAAAQTVSVTVGSDLLEVDGSTEATVAVAPGSTVQVPFKLLATKAGIAHLTITTRSSLLNETLESSVAVSQPIVSEAFSTTGRIQTEKGTGTASESLVIPQDTPADWGSLELTLASSRIAGLVGASDWVAHYPYGCFEQRASSLAPLLLFGDRPGYLKLAGIDDAHAAVANELGFWAKHQLEDGGYPMWPEDTDASFYISARVAHALALAKSAGYAIPEGIDTGKLIAYLRNPPAALRSSPYLMIYSLYVRSMWGDKVADEIHRYVGPGSRLGSAETALVGLTLVNSGASNEAASTLATLKRYIRPGTQTVDLSDPAPSTNPMYGSQVEELSLLLLLTEALEPQSDLVSRVAATLMSRERGGTWLTTTDVNWALQAFSAVLRSEEKGGAGGLTGHVSIGGTSLLDASFPGVETPPVSRRFQFAESPLSSLKPSIPYPIALGATGAGSLFYTATLRYAIPAESTAARDEGLGLFTRITGPDGKEVANAALRLGETYRLTLYLTSPRHRSFVAVRVPVPSGADILDTSLVTTARYDSAALTDEGVPDDEAPRKVILDNEVRFFFDDLPQGMRQMSFLFRATTAGIYPTPPASAKCMYEPAVFGRTAGQLYVIPRM